MPRPRKSSTVRLARCVDVCVQQSSWPRNASRTCGERSHTPSRIASGNGGPEIAASVSGAGGSSSTNNHSRVGSMSSSSSTRNSMNASVSPTAKATEPAVTATSSASASGVSAFSSVATRQATVSGAAAGLFSTSGNRIVSPSGAPAERLSNESSQPTSTSKRCSALKSPLSVAVTTMDASPGDSPLTRSEPPTTRTEATDGADDSAL